MKPEERIMFVQPAAVRDQVSDFEIVHMPVQAGLDDILKNGRRLSQLKALNKLSMAALSAEA
jgi:tRNA A37 methylthiotransferase MiaB